MFPRTYFPSRYFARLYWPDVEGVAPEEVFASVFVGLEGTDNRFHDTPGANTELITLAGASIELQAVDGTDTRLVMLTGASPELEIIIGT
jgi:hypothetical protein